MTNNINSSNNVAHTVIEASTAAVHNGVFHLDDVAAVWLLKKFNPGISVARTRNPQVIDNSGLAVDVGGKYDGERRFDHHQPDAPVRESGQKYSAFGQLWQVLGRELLFQCLPEDLVETAFAEFDREVVLPVDRRDNGAKDYKAGELADLGVLIGQFNSFEDPFSKGNDALFEKAVEAVTPFLDNYITLLSKKVKGAATIKKLLLEAASKGDTIAYIPQGLGPWKDVLTDKEIWNATLDMRGVLVSQGGTKWGITMWPHIPGPTFELRWVLEQSLKDDYGMDFIHANGFFGVFQAPSLEEALVKAKAIVSEATKVRYDS